MTHDRAAGRQSLVIGHWSFPRVHSFPTGSALLVRRGPGLHLVADRLLGRGDQLDRPALGLDLLLGRLGEVVGPDDQFLGDVALAENTDAVERLFRQPFRPQAVNIDLAAGVEQPVDVADVHDVERPGEHAVGEAPLGDAAEQGGLAADERDARQPGPGAGELALGPAAAGLAVPRADAPADPLLELALL